MATHQKKVQALNATLGFTDECGFLMAPLARRSLSPRGHTPILHQMGRYRYKVSAAAALTLSPGGAIHCYYQTYPELNVDGSLYALFLRNLLWQVRRPLVVVHDGGSIHEAPEVVAVQKQFPRLHLHRFPPYAPELNPVEYVWTDSKAQRLANFAPLDVPHLDRAIVAELEDFQHDQHRLRSFFARSPLPWNGLTVFF